MRVNREKTLSSSRGVRIGDVLTIALSGTVRVLRVIGFAERRGSATVARLLYEDLAPPTAQRDGPDDTPPSD